MSRSGLAKMKVHSRFERSQASMPKDLAVLILDIDVESPQDVDGLQRCVRQYLTNVRVSYRDFLAFKI